MNSPGRGSWKGHSEGRKPRAESRKKAEGRPPNGCATARFFVFGFRPSFGFRDSALGVPHISSLLQRALLRSFALGLVTLVLGAGCRPPGKPTEADIELRPEEVHDFALLYKQNCAGCHGQEGKGNSALALANPLYLAVANDDTIRRATAAGIRGSLMPAFAKKSGGTLTDQQIEILVREMRMRWAKPNDLLGADPPPYAAGETGNAQRGAGVYATFCAGCHGPAGRGTPKASSIVDDSFLALVSDQNLRTTIIAGRPDLNHPDWRHYTPDRAMTSQEVTDVVAWLVAQRKPNPGRPYASNDTSQKTD